MSEWCIADDPPKLATLIQVHPVTLCLHHLDEGVEGGLVVVEHEYILLGVQQLQQRNNWTVNSVSDLFDF